MKRTPIPVTTIENSSARQQVADRRTTRLLQQVGNLVHSFLFCCHHGVMFLGMVVATGGRAGWADNKPSAGGCGGRRRSDALLRHPAHAALPR
jgi:hypothetical protein